MGKQAIPGASRANMFLVDPDTLTVIGLDTKDGPEHPLYDERIHLPIDSALVNSLKARGNKVPIVVRKNGDVIEVVDGRQRVRCGRAANEELVAEGKTPIRIKAIVERGSDGDMFGVLILSNEIRQSDGPLAKAEKLRRYLDMGYTEDEAAITFGVTKQAVKNWLTLLELDPAVRNAVEAGTISATAASKLGSLSKQEQKESLKKLQESGTKVTAARTQRTARSRKNGASEEELPAPGKRQMRKVVERYYERDAEDPDPEFIRGIRWALGDIQPGSVKGLTKLLFGDN